jgi:hypothetical protein
MAIVDISNIKELIGITGTTEDSVIRIIKTMCQKVIMAYLRADTFPTALDYIADELAVRRYTKIGVEGVSQESIMSSSTTKYIQDDLQDYIWILERYGEVDSDNTRVNRLTMM